MAEPTGNPRDMTLSEVLCLNAPTGGGGSNKAIYQVSVFARVRIPAEIA